MRVEDIKGRPFVMFLELLAAGHEIGLAGTETVLLQCPTAENGWLAVVRMRIRIIRALPDGCTREESWEAIGDACPKSVSANIAPHIIRMAETRALGRCLRFAANIGHAMDEELGCDAGSAPDRAAQPTRSQEPRPKPLNEAALPISDMQMHAAQKYAADQHLPLDALCRDVFGTGVADITRAQMARLIGWLKQPPGDRSPLTGDPVKALEPGAVPRNGREAIEQAYAGLVGLSWFPFPPTDETACMRFIAELAGIDARELPANLSVAIINAAADELDARRKLRLQIATALAPVWPHPTPAQIDKVLRFATGRSTDSLLSLSSAQLQRVLDDMDNIITHIRAAAAKTPAKTPA